MQEVASATVRNSRKAHLPEASRCTPMTIGLMPGPTWAEVRGARLGQCAVLSEWLLTDYRFSFAHSLCGEEAVDCGDSEALSAMGGGGAAGAATA